MQKMCKNLTVCVENTEDNRDFGHDSKELKHVSDEQFLMHVRPSE